MKLTTLIAAVCAGSVTALPQTATAPAPVAPTPVPAAPVGGGTPVGGGASVYAACGVSPYSGALCCATDVLGVVDLDCHPSKSLPSRLTYMAFRSSYG